MYLMFLVDNIVFSSISLFYGDYVDILNFFCLCVVKDLAKR